MNGTTLLTGAEVISPGVRTDQRPEVSFASVSRSS